MLPSIDMSSLLQLIFYIVVLGFIIHAAIVSYHWLTYGVARSTSLMAVAVYLVGGSLLLITMSVALATI